MAMTDKERRAYVEEQNAKNFERNQAILAGLNAIIGGNGQLMPAPGGYWESQGYIPGAFPTDEQLMSGEWSPPGPAARVLMPGPENNWGLASEFHPPVVGPEPVAQRQAAVKTPQEGGGGNKKKGGGSPDTSADALERQQGAVGPARAYVKAGSNEPTNVDENWDPNAKTGLSKQQLEELATAGDVAGMMNKQTTAVYPYEDAEPIRWGRDFYVRGLPVNLGEYGWADTWVTPNEAQARLMAANEDQIAWWQDKLSRAGFMGFDSDGNPNLPQQWGVPDLLTTEAFGDFLEYSVMRGGFRQIGEDGKPYYSGNIEGGVQRNEPERVWWDTHGVNAPMGQAPGTVLTGKNWAQLLDEKIAAVESPESVASRGGGGGGRGRGGGGGGGAAVMPDPLAIKNLAQQLARLILGHELDEATLEEYVARVNAGAVGSVSSNQDFDVQANMVEWLRNDAATKVDASAHDLVSMYSTMTGLIGPMSSRAARGDERAGVTRV